MGIRIYDLRCKISFYEIICQYFIVCEITSNENQKKLRIESSSMCKVKWNFQTEMFYHPNWKDVFSWYLCELSLKWFLN